jgi:hypothetical protein
MDIAQKKRWAFLMFALAATIAAIFYPVDDVESITVVDAKPKVEPAIAMPEIVQSRDVEPEWIANDADPFSSKAWLAAPVVSAAPPQPAVVAPMAEAPPPPPPPLPYQFLGQMVNGNDRQIYLGRGDQVHVARLGDTLDGSYKIIQLTQTLIEFETISSGLKQTLPIPAQDN